MFTAIFKRFEQMAIVNGYLSIGHILLTYFLPLGATVIFSSFGLLILIPQFKLVIVAAALFGIGIESLVGRNGSIETFRAMLNLKIIWSSAAIIGFLLCIFSWVCEPPLFIWVLLAIFLAFNILWVYWRRILEKMSE